MNILYIAYSCDPYNGSEDKIGWNVPVESAKSNNVYVITKEEQRRSIEKYLSEHMLENIEFYFIDIPKFYKRIFKGFMYSGRLNVWHRRVFSLAKRICKEKNIDIIHQITPIEFRAIGDYGKIPNVKFVCGPLGGGEFIPSGLRSYAGKYKVVELLRTVINYWYYHKYNITRKLNKCDYIMFANKETCDFLIKKADLRCPYNLCFDNGLRNDELLADVDDNTIYFGEKKRCVFLVVGRMIYRKGHEFLLDVLENIPVELDYECRIVGDGPEMDKLQKKCSSNPNLYKHVIFTGKVPYMSIEKEYKNADVFIMPSIRETTGTVLLEAMSQGLPVITINKYGGATLIDEGIGWLYDGADKESYIEDLKKIIMECILNPHEVKARGKRAAKKSKQYTWEEKHQQYQNIYSRLLKE